MGAAILNAGAGCGCWMGRGLAGLCEVGGRGRAAHIQSKAGRGGSSQQRLKLARLCSSSSRSSSKSRSSSRGSSSSSSSSRSNLLVGGVSSAGYSCGARGEGGRGKLGCQAHGVLLVAALRLAKGAHKAAPPYPFSDLYPPSKHVTHTTTHPGVSCGGCCSRGGGGARVLLW